MSKWQFGACLLALMAAGDALAQATNPSSGQSAGASVAATEVAQCAIPAGTVVDLEIAEALSSAVQNREDKFRIRLRNPIEMGGSVVVPAGAEGVGEVIHAERSRGGGKPGEMLLTARYLTHDNRQLKLRSFKLGASGKDQSNVALGASLAIGAFALFIHGKEIEIPAGTPINAKLAEPLPFAANCTASPLPETATPQTTATSHQE